MTSPIGQINFRARTTGALVGFAQVSRNDDGSVLLIIMHDDLGPSGGQFSAEQAKAIGELLLKAAARN